MSTVTSFASRTRIGLRAELIAAAAALLSEHGYRGLRMTEVARAVGVSRQTVHTEFGDREQLTQAVLLTSTARFLTAVDRAMEGATDARSAVRDAVLAALRHAENDPLVVALVTGGATGAASDLLAFLADRHAEPVLDVCTSTVREHLERLAGGDTDTAAAAAVRLVVSHLLLPTGDHESAADQVATVTAAVLTDTATHP